MSQCGWLVSVSALLPAQISLYYLTNAGSFSIFARSRNPDNNNVTGSLNEVFCDADSNFEEIGTAYTGLGYINVDCGGDNPEVGCDCWTDWA